jgi:hypothetical protein
MDEPDAGKTIANKGPSVVIKLPGMVIPLTGRWALFPLVILLALAVVLIVYVVRSATWSWLWVSGGLWILFIRSVLASSASDLQWHARHVPRHRIHFGRTAWTGCSGHNSSGVLAESQTRGASPQCCIWSRVR